MSALIGKLETDTRHDNSINGSNENIRGISAITGVKVREGAAGSDPERQLPDNFIREKQICSDRPCPVRLYPPSALIRVRKGQSEM